VLLTVHVTDKGVIKVKQESCAIAKMTAQSALHMSALKVFECARIENLKCVALAVPEIIAIEVLVWGCET